MKPHNRREEILQAALELFAERGYYGTGMQDIAAAVGMKASSLYNHFGSKHEILANIMTKPMVQLLTDHARALSGRTTPTEKLQATIATHLAFHANSRLESQVTNREISHLQEPDRTQLTQLRRDYVARWIAMIQQGVDEGSFVCENPKITTYALIDMGIGVANWYRPDGSLTITELEKLYCDMAMKVLAP